MTGKAGDKKHPVLYLLHGMSDDHTIWLRRTSIERYVSDLGIAVVMPAVARSYYTDMHTGLKYWTFVSEELPRLAESFFPISDKREDTFAAGLSMGGYGAFKLALARPEKFAAAASLSGALDPMELSKHMPDRIAEHYSIFGDKPVYGTANDLFHLSHELANSSAAKPKLFQCCGTEDFLYQDNLKFKNHLNAHNFDLTYEEGPGTHEWGYWDTNIQRILRWLPLSR
jgi:S-formylglutathione hydrolase FrmB